MKKRINYFKKKEHKAYLKQLKNIKTEDNLQGFYESIKGSPYEKQFTGLSKEAILKIVNSDTLAYNLEPYLEDQRKAEITLTVEKIYMDTALFKELPLRFKNAIKTKDYAKAKIYQSLLFNAVHEGKADEDEVLKIAIPHFKETVSMNSNQLAFRWFYNKSENADSLYKHLLKEIQIQLNINPLNPYLNYNKTVLNLLLWSEDLMRETDPKNLLKDIKSLYGTQLEPYKIHQLMLNFNIISADYYYETKKFKERDKSLLEVKKMLLQSQLNKEQVEKISDYFIFQMRISWAIELMKPMIDNSTYDEDFLFTFLTIAIYDNKLIPQEEYNSLLNKAKAMNKERFCKLFGFPNMSFQLLKNHSVKQIYCETCHN
jgi:hypothetical protein